MQFWRPNKYYDNVLGSEIMRSFKVVKILDYRNKIPMLKKTSNPFGLIVLAQLSALSYQPNQEERMLSKLELIRFLLRHNWEEDKIRSMCIFLENLLPLRKELEVKYVNQLTIIEQEHEMKLMLSAERVGYWRGEEAGLAKGMEEGLAKGIETGVEKGLTKGAAHILIKLLQNKFNAIPEQYLQQIDRADTENLDKWSINVLHAKTIAEVFPD